jgi:hypothetical protein
MTTSKAEQPLKERRSRNKDSVGQSKGTAVSLPNSGKHGETPEKADVNVKSGQSVKKSQGNLPPGPGPGRPKGVPNKDTRVLKDMIMQALDGAGGVTYLISQATENPKAFLSLVGRVLPLQVTGEGDGPLTVIVKDWTGRKREEEDGAEG